MSKALSLDLRQRTLAAVLKDGLSHREAAARFKVSAASVSRWRALAADGAVPMHGPLGGDRRSHIVEGHADAILTVFHARRDMALAELQAELAEPGLRFGYGTLRRFVNQHRSGPHLRAIFPISIKRLGEITAGVRLRCRFTGRKASYRSVRISRATSLGCQAA
ncbi:helix-turn-helix domain-containing protein [Rhodovarius sp.]|uniref:helix-turn-helix domain-containing protein n=1 Tax=Rhodovarius sp. TaxID=2972673 RepID=UPI0034A474D4